MNVAALWSELEDRVNPVLAKYRRDIARLGARSKPDHTLLTDADVEIQSLIVDLIDEFDPSSNILAEEESSRGTRNKGFDRTWIVDPIDGTAQFANPASREYCSVVCMLENGHPMAAFILAPELSIAGGPICVTTNDSHSGVLLNGLRVPVLGNLETRLISATRSSSSQPRPFEPILRRLGYELKTRTTSQSLDMLRTVVDLTSSCGAQFRPFAAFYREQQKIWDGAAGISLAIQRGLECLGGDFRPRLSIDYDPDLGEPVLDATLIGRPDAVRDFVDASTMQ